MATLPQPEHRLALSYYCSATLTDLLGLQGLILQLNYHLASSVKINGLGAIVIMQQTLQTHVRQGMT